MTTTKKDTIATIKARMEEIEPYIREYKAYIAALEALGAPVQISVQDFIEQPVHEPLPATTRGAVRQRRRVIAQPVSKEQRQEEIIAVLYDHPDQFMNVLQISDLVPSESTPGAIGHRMNELLYEHLIEKYQDERSGRRTLDGYYAFRITEKGIKAYEAIHPEITNDDKEEVQKRRAKMTIHAGVGVVPANK